MVKRQHLVFIHRWIGLTVTVFLVITGLTGALLAWYDELDTWLAPSLHLTASPTAGQTPLDPIVLRTQVETWLSQEAGLKQARRVDDIPLHPHPGHTVRMRIAHPGSTVQDEVFVDPWQGTVQGIRPRGTFNWNKETLMPFIARVHYTLALPNPWGTLLLGVIAVLWTIDCFAGAILTLPKGRPFWNKWKTSWQIKQDASFHRRTLDLHRAGGLWFWGLLLVMAWSSVMFTLRDQIYVPIMSRLLPFDLSWRSVPKQAAPLATPVLGWQAALEQARHQMATLAQNQGFTVDFEERLRLDRGRGVYAYMVHSSADLRRDTGNTGILIDANTGEVRGQWLPTGGAQGNTFSNWLGALHMGHVFGWPYRVLLTVTGVATAVLAATGAILWWRKRRARRQKAPAT